MKISTRGRYALRLMMDLACCPGSDPVALKDVAERQGISPKYLEQIVGLLCKAGFVRSARGPQGGYRLSRAPENYTVGEILRLTEGSLAPVSCLEDAENLCERCSQCGTVDFWSGLYAEINRYIDKFSLADLVAAEQRKAQI